MDAPVATEATHCPVNPQSAERRGPSLYVLTLGTGGGLTQQLPSIWDGVAARHEHPTNSSRKLAYSTCVLSAKHGTRWQHSTADDERCW